LLLHGKSENVLYEENFHQKALKKIALK